MRKKFFFKNLILFLFPLLTAIIILGTLSIFITQQNITGEINRNNLILFNQIDRDIEIIFSEIDSLSISFGDAEVIYRLEEILRTQSLTLENLRLLKLTKDYINAPANARPYIESIYVYVNNPQQQFLASGQGLMRLDDFHDQQWKESFENHQQQQDIWTESRDIQRYSFEKPTPVTTVYKNLYSTLHTKPQGVIVLNIFTDYIERLLRNIESYPDQFIVVLDEQHRLVFVNRPLAHLEATISHHIPMLDSETSFTFKDSGVTYVGSYLHSKANGWRYVSIVPKKTLSSVPSMLLEITIFLVCFSLILGVVLTFFLTRRTVNHVRQIITIIKAAERNLPLPKSSKVNRDDEYEYIIQNIVKNFIEHNYLKVQLSEKKYMLQAAELQALHAQMNPHFLFNTLETINWKALSLTGRPNEVNIMIEKLSDLLKYSLESHQSMTPFKKEINNTKNYIGIQKIRYRHKFNVIWECDEEIYKYGTMKMVLQPLVENCIYHGIKEKEGQCAIKIKIWHLGHVIRIIVIDNGIGMTKDRLDEVRAMLAKVFDNEGHHNALHEVALSSIVPSSRGPVTDSHIGLYNTFKRLQLTYGSEASLTIKSKFNWGTVVSIHIPC